MRHGADAACRTARRARRPAKLTAWDAVTTPPDTVVPAPVPAGTTAGARSVVARPWRADAIALAVLVVVPVLAFVVPAALGHAVMPGDDAAQNFPLRVLVGQQLRAGHLPVLALPIWSGSQLLAGWNAGAAYPFTWLFAVLPGTAAWAFNEVLVWWVAGVGLYAFLRANRLRAFPSALGSVSFVFVGSMDAQVVHFGLVAGMSWVPVQLLAIMRLTEPRGTASRARWAALLAVAAAMTILAGEPRAIDIAVVVCGIYVLWRLVRARRRAGPVLWVVGAGALAACLAAVQLVPGLHAVASSQRAGNSAALFTSGSLPVRWLLLLLEPNLLGGSGSFGSPMFLASYNLTEVTGYVGLLPWVAAFALLAQLRRSHRGRPLPEWLVWHVVAAVGIVLALGGSTPAWHLLYHLPLFGSQRLQSRNIMVTDLAVAVLLAFWADDWLGRPRLADGARTTTRREQVLGAFPAVAAVAIGVASMGAGGTVLTWLGVTGSTAGPAALLRPWFVPTVALGAAAAGLVLAGHRWPRRSRRLAMGALVTADILCFAVTSLFQVAPPTGGPPPVGQAHVEAAADPPPGAVVPVDRLGIPGRFAVYDPALIQGSAVHAAGAPDQNLVVGGWSLQGYTAIVDGFYASATGSHGAMGFGQDVLSVPAIGDGTLDQLDPGALLTLPEYLLVDAGRAAAQAASGSQYGPDPAAGRRTLAGAGYATWWFGEPISLSTVTAAEHGAPPGAVQLGLIGPAGSLRWLPTSSGTPSGTPSGGATGASGGAAGASGGTLAASAGGARAVGLVARPTGPAGVGAVVGVPEVRTSAGTSLLADGVLQQALAGGRWRYAGRDGPLAVFAATHPSPPLAVRARPGHPLGAATVQARSGPALAPWSATVDSPHGAVVVRSVAAIAGWSARWEPVTGPARALPVRRTGLVQAVTVPAGRGVLVWTYRAPGLRTGEVAGIAGLVGLAGLLVVGRRRRRRAIQPTADPPR